MSFRKSAQGHRPDHSADRDRSVQRPLYYSVLPADRVSEAFKHSNLSNSLLRIAVVARQDAVHGVSVCPCRNLLCQCHKHPDLIAPQSYVVLEFAMHTYRHVFADRAHASVQTPSITKRNVSLNKSMS